MSSADYERLHALAKEEETTVSLILRRLVRACVRGRDNGSTHPNASKAPAVRRGVT